MPYEGDYDFSFQSCNYLFDKLHLINYINFRYFIFHTSYLLFKPYFLMFTRTLIRFCEKS